MKERPILMSAPMVLVSLDGSKTQTRRVVKYPTADGKSGWHPTPTGWEYLPGGSDRPVCPYGKPGDRLWVRETWAEVGTMDPGLIVYRADYPECVPAGYENIPPAEAITWKPSIHMFRKDSRILLEITGVRVERLQDISEADAKAEGCSPLVWDGKAGPADLIDWPLKSETRPYANDYALLWESINGAGSWKANPWVWIVEFKRLEPK